MPIYEYRCAGGHDFEVVQRMADDPVSECELCGKPVERVFSPVAVHYKGSGFYTTDYARKGKKDSDSGEKGEKGEKGESKSSDSSPSDSKKSDSKPSTEKKTKTASKDSP